MKTKTSKRGAKPKPTTIRLGAKPKMKTVDLHAVAADKIRAHVRSMCEYAIANQCVEQSHYEELDWMLDRFPRG